jgi:hypothetical protein
VRLFSQTRSRPLENMNSPRKITEPVVDNPKYGDESALHPPFALQQDFSFIDDVFVSKLVPHVVLASRHFSPRIKCLIQRMTFAKMVLSLVTCLFSVGYHYPTPAMLATDLHLSTLTISATQERAMSYDLEKIPHRRVARVLSYIILSIGLPFVWDWSKGCAHNKASQSDNFEPFTKPMTGEIQGTQVRTRHCERRAKLHCYVLTFLYRSIPFARLIHYGHVLRLHLSQNLQLVMEPRACAGPPTINMPLWIAGVRCISAPLAPSLIPVTSSTLNHMLIYRRIIWREMQACFRSWLFSLAEGDIDDRASPFLLRAFGQGAWIAFRSSGLRMATIVKSKIKVSNRSSQKVQSTTKERRDVGPHCPKCNTEPNRNSYRSWPCGHDFCFYCIREEIARCGMKNIACNGCGMYIKSSRRLSSA